jgi:hypothetical protein
MAELTDELWRFNFAKVVVLDVTDDYALMQAPLPISCYPVLSEELLPVHVLDKKVCEFQYVKGFLYDWHKTPNMEDQNWYVGVVDEELIKQYLR